MAWALGAVGLLLILAFGIQRLLLRAGLLSRPDPGTSGAIIQSMLRYGLYFGVLLIPLAVGLEFARTGVQGWQPVVLFLLAVVPFLALVHRQGDPAHPDSIAAPDRKSIRLVGYLADRLKQERALDGALRSWLEMHRAAAARTPPFVCVTHGRECEHAFFLERIEKDFLPHKVPALKTPTVLKFAIAGAVADPELLHWSMMCEVKRTGFAARASDSRRPVLVAVRLLEDDWFEKDGENPVTCFARFWQTLPQPAGPVLAFLCFRVLNDKTKARQAAAWFQSIIPDPGGHLDTPGFRERFGLPGVILPELGPVTHHDAIRWADNHTEQHHDLPHLKQQISEHFQRRNDKPVPMNELGPWLNQLLPDPPP